VFVKEAYHSFVEPCTVTQQYYVNISRYKLHCLRTIYSIRHDVYHNYVVYNARRLRFHKDDPNNVSISLSCIAAYRDKTIVYHVHTPYKTNYVTWNKWSSSVSVKATFV